MRVGFGLDLAGYSTGKSELAVAYLTGNRLRLTLLKDSPFARKVSSLEKWESVVSAERDALAGMLGIGPVAVDVPIDLQGLPQTPTSGHVWGLTKRPIDYALNALPPFADRLGSVVSRFQGILRSPELASQLGSGFYETYPSASLAATGHVGKGYKGPKGGDGRVSVGRHLNLGVGDFSDDELDAMICALTAVGANVLDGKGLDDIVVEKAGPYSAPKGYRLLSKLPDQKIEVERMTYAKWLVSR